MSPVGSGAWIGQTSVHRATTQTVVVVTSGPIALAAGRQRPSEFARARHAVIGLGAGAVSAAGVWCACCVRNTSSRFVVGSCRTRTDRDTVVDAAFTVDAVDQRTQIVGATAVTVGLKPRGTRITKLTGKSRVAGT